MLLVDRVAKKPQRGCEQSNPAVSRQARRLTRGLVPFQLNGQNVLTNAFRCNHSSAIRSR